MSVSKTECNNFLIHLVNLETEKHDYFSLENEKELYFTMINFIDKYELFIDETFDSYIYNEIIERIGSELLEEKNETAINEARKNENNENIHLFLSGKYKFLKIELGWYEFSKELSNDEILKKIKEISRTERLEKIVVENEV